MPMFLQGRAPRRLPFTDWVAQVERIIERDTRETIQFDRGSSALQGCYNVGLSPQEIAGDYTAWRGARR